MAFCFFIAGYALGVNKELTQSIGEVQKLVSLKGFFETIKHLYIDRQVGWILRVFWLIMFVAVGTVRMHSVSTTNESGKWIGAFFVDESGKWIGAFFVAASGSLLQYLVFSLLLLDAFIFILWLVQAILKLSGGHTADEIEINVFKKRRKVKDIIPATFLINCIVPLCSFYFCDDETYQVQYPIAAVVLSLFSCIGNPWFALLLCNTTLQTLSISWGTVWAHVRAILLTICLLSIFIYMTWSLEPKLFTSEIVELVYHISLIVAAIMQTIKMLIVYILYVFDFLSPNGIEQVQEKVYMFHFIADIFALMWAVLLFITIVWVQPIIEMHFGIAIGE